PTDHLTDQLTSTRITSELITRRSCVECSPKINKKGLKCVARILAKEAGVSDLATLQAAILHDTVEDTDTTFEEIEKHFGKEVRDIVDDVTDDKSLPKMERKRRQIEHAPHCCPKAKLVKLADKLYNLRDLDQEIPQGWTKERAQEYFQWASQVVQGLRGTNKEMEASLDELFAKHGVVVET
ncbi:guanosine-3',5'-bis(diphosphate) 3'-pyrophosphohydrolase MESH1-like, partial [Lytechinus pictus]|uniref:guanosine-3',5'-bis(diphosphate) 3'-pyrophosphohydrolase MESH1-like n=1 Tax=Lytechinus pictus TaxID=7653 RepID=UPI0030BA13D4